MTVETQTVRIYPSGPLSGSVRPPSSKYHTLRYVLAAALAPGYSVIHDPAQSDDTGVLLKACQQLGVSMRFDDAPAGSDAPYSLMVTGNGGQITAPPGGELDVGNAGAVLRLLLAICALSPDPITLTTTYSESLGRRPNADLLQALKQLGAKVDCQSLEGTLPIRVQREQLHGGNVQISGKKSSQYISSLLYLAPLLEEGLEIEIVDGLASANFVDLTIGVLAEAGIEVITGERYRLYVVPGRQQYRARAYTIPGDYPSAAALLAAVAVAGGEITITNLQPDGGPGDLLLELFARMGVQIVRDQHNQHTVTARMSGPLKGITFDGGPVTDSVPVIAAAACLADGHSRIYNVANLHYKESDRIDDLAAELNRLGCRVVPSGDALDIYPAGAGGVRGGESEHVDAHSDHRLVQALAVVGLASKQPVTIEHAGHISKSYPGFFADLESLGTKIGWV